MKINNLIGLISAFINSEYHASEQLKDVLIDFDIKLEENYPIYIYSAHISSFSDFCENFIDLSFYHLESPNVPAFCFNYYLLFNFKQERDLFEKGLIFKLEYNELFIGYSKEELLFNVYNYYYNLSRENRVNCNSMFELTLSYINKPKYKYKIENNKFIKYICST